MSETPFQVLARPIPSPQNFYEQDPVLQAVLARQLSPQARAWLAPQLSKMGALAAGPVTEWAATADRLSPQLRSYDRFGQRVDEVVYHPAYRQMEEVAYGSGMIGLKYDRALRARFPGDLQVAGFALSYLFAQSESGLTCPACMTDGVARVLELHGTPAQQAKWIPRLAAQDTSQLLTGAMFLTEKQGGSDVGQNATRAVRQADGSWRLHGEKWFCSNVDGGLKLVLARPDDAPAGTRGLGLFLVAHHRDDGSRNAIQINRLKEKLGVRSMASGECVLDGTEAELVGGLESGFKHMTDMLNLSRMWNSVCSISIARRAAFEATQYLRIRRTFGEAAIRHPLVRETLADLNAEEIGGKVLIFQLARHLDLGDGGSERDKQLVRILTPLVKYTTAKTSVWAASEGLELIGGNGYVEDSIMPRLLRDAQVLPVWEGTTNILVLDTLRVITRNAAHETLFDETGRRCGAAPEGLQNEANRVRAMVAAAKADLAIIGAEGPEGAAGLLRRFTDRALYAYEISLLLDPAYVHSAMGPTFVAAARRLLLRRFDYEARLGAEDIEALVGPVVGAARA